MTNIWLSKITRCVS